MLPRLHEAILKAEYKPQYHSTSDDLGDYLTVMGDFVTIDPADNLSPRN